MLMILGLLNPAPTDAHIFAIPCLDTLADQNTHLLRQHPRACLLDHRSEPRERACHRRIRSRPGQVIGQIRLWNELQRVTVLEMANHLLARRRAQQAPAQSLQRRRQRQKRIPQKHIDHAVDIVEGDRAADDLWGIVMRKWWLQNPTHIGCPVCQYPLNECMKLLMVDAVVVTSKVALAASWLEVAWSIAVCASTQNGHAFVFETVAATASLSARSTWPASSVSRRMLQTPAITSGTGECRVSNGTGRKSACICR